MKNSIKCFILIAFCIVSCKSVQYPDSTTIILIPENKNGLYYSSFKKGSGEELILTEKEIMGNLLNMSYSIKYGKNRKVIDSSVGDIIDSTYTTKDSINETFIVQHIDTVKYTYTKEGNQFRPKLVYNISLRCVSNPELTFTYPLLSIDKECKDLTKIEVGKEYKLLLHSYFTQDGYRQGSYYNIRLDDVYMVLVPMHVWGMNFYTTNNLKGLYYVPNGS